MATSPADPPSAAPRHARDRDPGASVTKGDADYRKLANALPQIIWTCDAHGQLDWVNDRWMQLTGLSREESLSDKGALAAVHPDDREALQQRFAEALTTGSPCEIEYRIRNREGAYRFHLCRVAPVRDDAGAVERWVAAAFDMQDRRSAEDALRASERRFETIFAVNPQAMAITRLSDGTFLSVNDAFEKMTGYSSEEVVGKTGVELGAWTPEQRASAVGPSRDEPVLGFDISFSTKDGRVLTLAIVSARIDEGDEPRRVSLATDVTERRKTEAALRESEALARARADEIAALMDAVPAAVWIAQDPECRRVRGNRTGRELLRMEEGQNLSKAADDPAATRHFRVLVDQVEVPATDLPLQRAARGDEVRNHEHVVRFDDGTATHLYGTTVCLRDPAGAPRGAIGAFVDVTRLKEAEATMRDVDRRKDEFLALLSHELRNPLAPIVTAAQLMQLRGDVATPREREVILRQAQHLLRLVDDLLDVSRVARGKVTLTKRTVELASVVARAVEATAPMFEQRRHVLRLSVPSTGLWIDADEVRLTQVVSNLLTNAARYTPEEGLVEVTAARQGTEVVLRVCDTGMGIDAALLPHLFEMFVQGARGPDRAEGGLGLGLNLVRTLTALHGGSVSATSGGIGKGSEFTIRLPATDVPLDAASAPGRPVRAGERSRRILVVDDNNDAAEMISLLLAEAGHLVRVAHDASQALAVADAFRPQVAILDIGLPVMDGYTLGRELRARMGNAAPILIALTGYGHERDQRRSREAGFSVHLVKPVDAEVLSELVGALGYDGGRARRNS